MGGALPWGVMSVIQVDRDTMRKKNKKFSVEFRLNIQSFTRFDNLFRKQLSKLLTQVSLKKKNKINGRGNSLRWPRNTLYRKGWH
jgi:hypothetical protein